jgi:predicted ATP-dependent serine protease
VRHIKKKDYAASSLDSGIVPSGELLGMEFETIGLQGKYRELLGDPSVGFSAMVFGLPKSGKSTFCLGFAHHLAMHHGQVLYCAIEEGFGYTLKEKIERLGASHPRLLLSDQVPETLEGYDFVFIDSVSKAGLDLSELEALREDHPCTSFIFIYHTTKAGRFRGENAHAHEVDVIVQVAEGEISANGRFASGGKVKMEEIV